MRRLIAIALMVAACGGSGDESVRGRVIAVDGDLLVVRSFVVLAEDGTQFEFVPAAGVRFDNGAPLPHLQEHLRDGEPVIVEYDRRGDGLVAMRVGDG